MRLHFKSVEQNRLLYSAIFLFSILTAVKGNLHFKTKTPDLEVQFIPSAYCIVYRKHI